MKKVKRPKTVTYIVSYKSASNGAKDSVLAKIMAEDFYTYFVGKNVRDTYEKVTAFLTDFAKVLKETPNMVVPAPLKEIPQTPQSIATINVKKGTLEHGEIK